MIDNRYTTGYTISHPNGNCALSVDAYNKKHARDLFAKEYGYYDFEEMCNDKGWNENDVHVEKDEC